LTSGSHPNLFNLASFFSLFNLHLIVFFIALLIGIALTLDVSPSSVGRLGRGERFSHLDLSEREVKSTG
jgi:hypothetical protein